MGLGGGPCEQLFQQLVPSSVHLPLEVIVRVTVLGFQEELAFVDCQMPGSMHVLLCLHRHSWPALVRWTTTPSAVGISLRMVSRMYFLGPIPPHASARDGWWCSFTSVGHSRGAVPSSVKTEGHGREKKSQSCGKLSSLANGCFLLSRNHNAISRSLRTAPQEP